jgi:hypothetical protein
LAGGTQLRRHTAYRMLMYSPHEAERRSQATGQTIGSTTLARQLIAEGPRPPARRVTVELEVGEDGRVRALPIDPQSRDVA